MTEPRFQSEETLAHRSRLVRRSAVCERSLMNIALNHPASGNGATTSLFHVGRLMSAVPEPVR
jgi:hypothetical protein